MLLLMPILAVAQYESFSIGLTSGLALPNYTLAPKAGYAFEGSIQYSPLRQLSVSLDLGKHMIAGEGALNVPTGVGETTERTYESSTNLFVYGAGMLLNLPALFTQKAPKRIIPYLRFGTGFTDTKINTNIKGSSVSESFNNVNFISWVGLSARIHGKANLDYIVKAQYYFVESKYLELLQYDDEFDHFFTLTFGVSFNHSGKTGRQHLHWTSKQKCPTHTF